MRTSQRLAPETRGGATLAVRIPHPIYQLMVEDLLSDRPLEAAKQVGVRYFVGDPGSPATADVGIDAEGMVSGFQSLTRGPQANAMWEALDQAATMDPAQEARDPGSGDPIDVHCRAVASERRRV